MLIQTWHIFCDFHWSDCCFVFRLYPETYVSSPVVICEMKFRFISQHSLSSLYIWTLFSFWLIFSSQGTNLPHYGTFQILPTKFSGKSHMKDVNFHIHCELWKSLWQFSWALTIFASLVPVEEHLECSSEILPFEKHLHHHHKLISTFCCLCCCLPELV